MTKTDSTAGASSPRGAARKARDERLAAALKVNLRRRKLQARERAADAGQRDHATEPARNPAMNHDPGS
jgi:hypothetical protein